MVQNESDLMSTSTDGSPMTLWTRARSASVSFGSTVSRDGSNMKSITHSVHGRTQMNVPAPTQ